MFRFLTLNKKILIAFILLIGIFVLLSPEIKQSPKYNLIERPFLTITGFIQSGLTTISQGISSTWNGYLNLINVQKENEMLVEEVKMLRSEVIYLREKISTGDRLTELLKLEDSYVEKQVAASIIAKDPANWYEALVINKGEKEGVEPGMGVITAGGVIGRVVKTSPDYSRVLLMSDRNSAVAGLIQRTLQTALLDFDWQRLECSQQRNEVPMVAIVFQADRERHTGHHAKHLQGRFAFLQTRQIDMTIAVPLQ